MMVKGTHFQRNRLEIANGLHDVDQVLVAVPRTGSAQGRRFVADDVAAVIGVS